MTREEILSKRTLKQERINVPAWGGEVNVRELTAGEKERLEALYSGEHTGTIQATVVSMVVLDDNGERVFTDDDIGALSSMSGSAIQAIFKAATRLSGVTTEAREELEKN